MAQTPSTSRLTTGKQTGSAPGQAINEVTQVAPGGYNVFSKPWNNFITPRFAEITPFFFADTVGKSKELLVNTHQVRAHTMAAPNMQEIRMHKSYYSVPKEAIMRNTWKYWVKTPKHGDDVPKDTCYPGVSGNVLGHFLSRCMTTVSASLSTEFEFTDDRIDEFFQSLGILNLFCSSDSLLALLGFPLGASVSVTENIGRKHRRFNYVDWVVELLVNSFANVVNEGDTVVRYQIIDSYNYMKSSSSSNLNENRFELIRDLVLTLITDSDFKIFEYSGFSSGLKAARSEYKKHNFSAPFVDISSPFISFDLVKAYQMACAQFFTNSDVDDVYTYDMWEDNSLSLERSISSPSLPANFTYNGVDVYCDSYSQLACDAIFSSTSSSVDLLSLWHYVSNLLCIRRSLMYQDYFYGGRISPLAVGDVDVVVNKEKVSAIDITKSIIMQRFLNAVNKIPGDILSYLKGIFGYSPLRIPPQPIFLAQDTFAVTGELVNNTAGEEQGNLVQNISFRDSDRGYEVYNDCESFIVGFVWFDYVQAYSDAIDRLRLKNDRYDFFQPYMQTIGDQATSSAEVSCVYDENVTMSWQIRNMEYKQRFSRKSGGFVEHLPSWTIEERPIPFPLSPNAIRNENRVIDRLYKSLTGASMGSYFHFIMSNHNNQVSNLPMLRQPGIL